MLCLGTYPKDIKCGYKYLYTELITTASSIIVKSGNKLKVQKWVNNYIT